MKTKNLFIILTITLIVFVAGCAEKVFKRLINLPINPNMSLKDAKKIAEKVIKYL